MFYQTSLADQLIARYNRAASAQMSTYKMHTANLVSFIRSTPYLAALVQVLDLSYPDISWAAIDSDHFEFRHFTMPDDQGESAKIVWGMLLACVDDGQEGLPWIIGMDLISFNDTNAAVQAFGQHLVSILCNYLLDRIVAGSNTLYLLEKYKNRVEWFHRQALLERVNAIAHQHEKVVDDDLREYLFNQGIDYPFSQPLSPSGRADVVAHVGEPTPLVLEIKLFDPARSYGRRYLAQGFRQALDYAHDYGQTIGYLVIFNCSPHRLVFQTGNTAAYWPPRVEVGHVTVFLIVIDLYVYEESASKRGMTAQYMITKEHLVNDTGEADTEPSEQSG